MAKKKTTRKKTPKRAPKKATKKAATKKKVDALLDTVKGAEHCMHAHVGFLARGEIHIEYADGCIVELKAPQIIAIDPGHDGWVVGSEPVVMIEFDFEGDTVNRLGMPAAH